MRETKPVEAKQWNDRLEDMIRYLDKLERFRHQIEREIDLLQNQLPKVRGYTDSEALVIKLSVLRQLEQEEKLARQLLEHVQAECLRLGIPVAADLMLQPSFQTQFTTAVSRTLQ